MFFPLFSCVLYILYFHFLQKLFSLWKRLAWPPHARPVQQEEAPGVTSSAVTSSGRDKKKALQGRWRRGRTRANEVQRWDFDKPPLLEFRCAVDHFLVWRLYHTWYLILYIYIYICILYILYIYYMIFDIWYFMHDALICTDLLCYAMLSRELPATWRSKSKMATCSHQWPLHWG